MKNKTLILIFILILQAQNITFANNQVENNGLSKKISNFVVTQEEKRKKNKLNKRLLKKEIKKRKRYHRNLLYLYNKNFDKKILYNITQNGLIITSLKEVYKKII